MNKKGFMQKLLYILILLFVVGSFNYFVDAQQQIRYNKNYVSGEQRVINNGLARNYTYDTIIIGSSTSENILKKDVDQLFNVNSVNLSLSGSTALEHKNLLNIVIQEGKVKNVIYGLDVFNYNRLGIRNEIVDYGKNKEELLKYLLNISSLKTNVKIIIKELLGKNKKDWIYTWSFWGNQFTFSEENTLCFNEKLQFGAQNLGVIKEVRKGYDDKILKYNVDEFFKIVEKTPNIDYKIYFPPYSILYWYALGRYNCLESVLSFKKYVYLKSREYPNVFIYDFQDDISVIENLNNYKDSVHFSDLISKKITYELVTKKANIENCNFSNRIKESIKKSKNKFDKIYKENNIE